tara:strand:+ start:163 stop:819 length:657 start_codon:yes stop_codon:yes gene_type:complete
MKLFTDLVEDVQVLTEGTGDTSQYHIQGIFIQGNKKNRNGRLYPTGVLEQEVSKYVESHVAKKRAFGELGHPEGPTINLDRVSHLITELVQDGNNFIGKAKIMDTPSGKIVKSLMDEGAQLGVSTRGMGTLKPNSQGYQEVQSDFSLATAADIVVDPSAPDAFVNGIMEGVEWVWDNGLLKASEVEVYKEEIDANVRTNSLTEEKKLEILERFFKSLS